MKRKYKILISVIIAAAIMITGSAATVMAEDDPATDTPVPELYCDGEVILDLIDQAVEDGLITPEEAEILIAWWEDRPELIDELFDSTGIFHLVRNRNMYMYKTKATLTECEGNMERSKLQIKYRHQNLNGNALGNGTQNQIKVQTQGISAVKMQARGISAGQMKMQNSPGTTE